MTAVVSVYALFPAYFLACALKKAERLKKFKKMSTNITDNFKGMNKSDQVSHVSNSSLKLQFYVTKGSEVGVISIPQSLTPHFLFTNLDYVMCASHSMHINYN